MPAMDQSYKPFLQYLPYSQIIGTYISKLGFEILNELATTTLHQVEDVNIIRALGRGSNNVVSVLAYNSDNTNSNPAEVYTVLIL